MDLPELVDFAGLLLHQVKEGSLGGLFENGVGSSMMTPRCHPFSFVNVGIENRCIFDVMVFRLRLSKVVFGFLLWLSRVVFD